MPPVCEPWLENSGGAETGSARCREGVRVRGSGLLVTAGASQAGWMSGVWLRQHAGLGDREKCRARLGKLRLDV